MNVYDCCGIGNAGDACTIASNLVCDSSRTTTWRHRQYLKLLKVKGNACAVTLHRRVIDVSVESC